LKFRSTLIVHWAFFLSSFGDIAHWSMARAPIARAAELKRLMADMVTGVGWVTVYVLKVAVPAVPAVLRYVVTVVAVPVTSLASPAATEFTAVGRNLKQFQV